MPKPGKFGYLFYDAILTLILRQLVPISPTAVSAPSSITDIGIDGYKQW